MLYFQRNDSGTLQAVEEYGDLDSDRPYIYRGDFETFADAQAVADELNGLLSTDKYIATDAGRCRSPRYDVVARPQIGDKVSYAFNGDSYPCGSIIKISPTLKKISTTTGDTFYRVRKTGSWKKNGTWSLISGHHNERNPSF